MTTSTTTAVFDKSTNVRSFDHRPALVPGLEPVRALARVLPRLAARVATSIFFLPPRPRAWPATDQALFEAAIDLRVRVRGQSLRAWRFSTGPRVLVQHGWGGSTAQMSAIIRGLVDAGFGVVAVDAPGHGASGWRRSSSIVHFADAIEALVEQEGPVVAAVGHSLGATAVALAASRGLGAERLVLLAPFDRPAAFYRGFLELVGLPRDAIDDVQRRSESTLGIAFDRLALRETLVAASASTLIVHDADDRRVPRASSEAIARELPAVAVLETEGLGHTRILRDATVVDRIVREVQRARPGTRNDLMAAIDRDLAPGRF